MSVAWEYLQQYVVGCQLVLFIPVIPFCYVGKSDRMIESIAQWKEKPMVSRCVMFVI